MSHVSGKNTYEKQESKSAFISLFIFLFKDSEDSRDMSIFSFKFRIHILSQGCPGLYDGLGHAHLWSRMFNPRKNIFRQQQTITATPGNSEPVLFCPCDAFQDGLNIQFAPWCIS